MSERFTFSRRARPAAAAPGGPANFKRWALVVAAVCISLAWGLGKRTVRQLIPGAAPQVPEAQQRLRGVAEAFRSEPVPANSREAMAIRRWLDRLTADVQTADLDRVAAHIDADRLVDRVYRHEVSLPLSLRTASAKKQLGSQFGRRMAEALATIRWERAELRQVRLSNDGTEAEIIVRLRYDDVGEKMRFWLVSQQGKWRICDFEDLNFAIPASLNAALAMAEYRDGLRVPPPSLTAEVFQHIRNGQWDEMKVALDKLDRYDLPPMAAANIDVFRGAYHAQIGEYAEALRWYDKAARVRSDIPMLLLLQAIAYNALEQHDQALKYARQYQQLLGDDASTMREVGNALLGLGRRDEAVAAYQQGLTDTPSSADCLYGLARSLPLDRLSELAEHARRAKLSPEGFHDLANLLYHDGYLSPLRALLDGSRARHGDSASWHYFNAQLLLADGEPLAAAETIQQGLAVVGDDEPLRALLEEGLVLALTRAGKPLAAYRAADNRPQAFRQIAAALYSQPALLAALIELHRQQHADDVWLAYFEARRQYSEGDLQRAADTLRDVLSDVAYDEVPDFLDDYLWWMYHLGRPLEAYEHAPDKVAAFETLIELLLEDPRHHDAAQELITRHAQDRLMTLPIAWRQARLAMLRDGPQAAEAQYRKLLAQADPNDHWGQTFLEGYVEAMIAQGKPLEAYRTAPAAQDQVFRMVAQRASGEPLADLLKARRHDAPDDPWLAFYEAQQRHAEEDHAAAARLALELVHRTEDRPDDDLRRRCLWLFYEARLAQGAAEQALREAPDPAHAFSYLAGKLVEWKKTEELWALFQARRASGPVDYQLLQYGAEACILSEKYDQAQRLLQEAVRYANEPWQPDHLRMRRVDVAYLAGRGAEAYDSIPPPNATLAQLVGLCRTHRDEGLLRILIEKHRARAPEDVRLLWMEALALQLGGDDGALIRFLQQHRADMQPQPQFALDYLRMLIPALVRSGHFDEAHRELVPETADATQRALYTALIAIGANDVAAAEQALHRLKQFGWQTVDMYYDPDLGPALRGEAMARLRADFPDPFVEMEADTAPEGEVP